MEHKEAATLLRPFVEVAIQGLAQMYDPQKGQFCRRVVRQGADVQVQGYSSYESVVALLGLYEAYHFDIHVPFNMLELTKRYAEGVFEFSSLTELGVALWMMARSHPEHLGALYEQISLSTALDEYADARAGNTKALSSFLTGLSEIRLSDGAEPAQLDELALMVRQMLFVNYGGFGVFRHTGKRSLLSRTAVRYGTLQDQVFGSYAFARYSRAFNDDQALEVALQCAKQLVANQGELGQWWHSYEVSTGNKARKYPVRSVNQGALVPLALNEVSKLAGLEVADAVEYGLLWTLGENELDMNLLDRERVVLWEGVYDTRYNTYAKEWSVTKGLRPQKDKKRTLTLSWECRPSALGWLLFALSGQLESH